MVFTTRPAFYLCVFLHISACDFCALKCAIPCLCLLKQISVQFDVIVVGARCISMVTAFTHGAMGRRIDPSWVDPLSYFSFKPVLHDWCNKGCGVFYPVCGMMHIKEPLLLIGKSSPCGGSRFPLSLSECSFTQYNRK